MKVLLLITLEVDSINLKNAIIQSITPFELSEFEKDIQEMIIEEEFGNEYIGNLIIHDYPNLQSIVVKKKSLRNLKSLKICDCEKLKHFEIEDFECINLLDRLTNSSFQSVNNLSFSSIFPLEVSSISSKFAINSFWIFIIHLYRKVVTQQYDSERMIKFIDIPNLQSLRFGKGCFSIMQGDVVIENYPHLEEIVVERDALKNLDLLKISNNEQLRNIEFEDGDEQSYMKGACSSVNTLVIESI